MNRIGSTFTAILAAVSISAADRMFSLPNLKDQPAFGVSFAAAITPLLAAPNGTAQVEKWLAMANTPQTKYLLCSGWADAAKKLAIQAGSVDKIKARLNLDQNALKFLDSELDMAMITPAQYKEKKQQLEAAVAAQKAQLEKWAANPPELPMAIETRIMERYLKDQTIPVAQRNFARTTLIQNHDRVVYYRVNASEDAIRKSAEEVLRLSAAPELAGYANGAQQNDLAVINALLALKRDPDKIVALAEKQLQDKSNPNANLRAVLLLSKGNALLLKNDAAGAAAISASLQTISVQDSNLKRKVAAYIKAHPSK